MGRAVMEIANFRFQIVETGRMRKPVVWILGNILEGTIHLDDRLSVPLRDGTTAIARIVEILHPGRASIKSVIKSVSFGECEDDMVMLTIYRGCHESEDISCDVASLYVSE
jgi:hypothetical protein